MIPSLCSRCQNEREPMRRNRRMKKRHGESREGDGSENRFVHIRKKCGKSLSAAPFRTKIIGLVGFEPTACRRGDRSTLPYQAHLYLVRSCNIARVASLRSEWQSIHYGLEATVPHVSLASLKNISIVGAEGVGDCFRLRIEEKNAWTLADLVVSSEEGKSARAGFDAFL